MKLDAVKIGYATAIVFAVFWVLCSMVVVIMPVQMLQLSGHMIHADLANPGWTLTWTGFIAGLIAWSVLAGIVAWAIAAVYNRLLG